MSDRLKEEIKPEPGSVWAHRNGLIYEVLFLTNEDTEHPVKYPVTVVYRGSNGKLWSRTLSDWHRSMTFVSPEHKLKELREDHARLIDNIRAIIHNTLKQQYKVSDD